MNTYSFVKHDSNFLSWGFPNSPTIVPHFIFPWYFYYVSYRTFIILEILFNYRLPFTKLLTPPCFIHFCNPNIIFTYWLDHNNFRNGRMDTNSSFYKMRRPLISYPKMSVPVINYGKSWDHFCFALINFNNATFKLDLKYVIYFCGVTIYHMDL